MRDNNYSKTGDCAPVTTNQSLRELLQDWPYCGKIATYTNQL